LGTANRGYIARRGPEADEMDDIVAWNMEGLLGVGKVGKFGRCGRSRQ